MEREKLFFTVFEGLLLCRFAFQVEGLPNPQNFSFWITKGHSRIEISNDKCMLSVLGSFL